MPRLECKDSPRFDLTGQKFGRLLVLEYCGKNKNGHPMWKCRCDCGKETTTYGSSLKTGHTSSCGCYQKDQVRASVCTHALSRTKEHQAWLSMKHRVRRSNFRKRKNYAERNITVCPEWENDLEQFIRDLGPCPPGYTLERRDNNKGYEKGNTIWADSQTQNNNKRITTFITFRGRTQGLGQWATELRMSRETIRGRLKRGLNAEQALSGINIHTKKPVGHNSGFYVPTP